MDGDMTAPGLTRYAALYIDVPNIIIRGNSAEGRARFALTQIHWSSLVSQMLGTLGTERHVCVGAAYVLVGKDNPHRADRIPTLRAGLGPHCGAIDVIGTRGDVDSKIVIDMWADIIGLSRELGRKGHPFPHDLTILLASGDHIYANAVERMRDTFLDQLNLRLHVFSWDHNLSGVLRAASQHVTILDQDPPFIELESI